MLEVLEDRWLPSAWTNAGGDNLWSNPDNWDGGVPGSLSYVTFHDTYTDDPCIIDVANVEVDRIDMGGYSGTLTIPTGVTVSTNNYLLQDGRLNLDGILDVGSYMHVSGLVVTSAPRATGTSAVLDAAALWNNGGTIVVAGTATPSLPAPPTLTITADTTEDAGTIIVGAPGGGVAGLLTIAGHYRQYPFESATVHQSSILSFLSGEAGPDYPMIQGTYTLGLGTSGGPSGGATISTDTRLEVSGGDLISVGTTAPNVISGTTPGNGDVAIVNGGAVTVDDGNTLSMLTGSLTVGALTPELPETGGTLTLDPGSTLLFPLSPVPSTFVVTPLGVIDMNGATINMDASRVAQLELYAGGPSLGGGVLNSLPGISGVNTIIGNLLNRGTIAFAGDLHTLAILDGAGPGGNYTQNADGKLSMRLHAPANDPVNDALTVAGTATLGGELELTDLTTLAVGDTWDLIFAGNDITTNFNTITWPDEGGWIPIFGVGPTYSVRKVAPNPPPG